MNYRTTTLYLVLITSLYEFFGICFMLYVEPTLYLRIFIATPACILMLLTCCSYLQQRKQTISDHNIFIERHIEKGLSVKDSQIQELQSELNGIKNLLGSLESSVSVKENIETIIHARSEWIATMMYQIAEDTLARTRLYNLDADTWTEEIIPFKISPSEDFKFQVEPSLGMIPIAVKFFSGDGYGKYIFLVNEKERSLWFVKRKNGNEDGAVFLPSRMVFMEQGTSLRIIQVFGEGTLECGLYVIKAGNRSLLHVKE